MVTKVRQGVWWQSKQSPGFALLMTIIVVSVVLSIGISMLDVARKQVRLASNVKESEKAFHATNAGMECARFWRRSVADTIEDGGSFTPTCFGMSAGLINPSSSPAPTLDDITDAEAHLYKYEITWGAGVSERCTKVTMLVASTTVEGDGVEVQNMQTLFPGYPDGNLFTCENGGRCSVISVKGYNKACGSTNTYGTLEREVLLEL